MAEHALFKRLKALIAFRVLFVTVLLGSFFVFQIGYKIFPYPFAILYLIIFLYSLSIVYAFLLGKVKELPFAYVQICIDVASIIALIFITGGIESWFSSLMLLMVISAAMVVNKKAGYVTATLMSIFYGSLIDFQFYGLLHIPYDSLLFEKDFLYNIFSHICALYLTAYLIGSLTSRLEKKDIDLRDLTLFNKEVIENTPSGLFTTGPEGIVLLFNRAAEDITGIGREVATGKHIVFAFPFLEHIKEQTRIEEAVDFGGNTKVIGLSISRMQDTEGAETGFIGIFQDLTELKKMAEEMKQKEKMAAIGELSTNIAHEIRNPLASLKGSVEMLREDAITIEQKHRLMSIALGEMDRLDTIITDFLNYSRPGKLEVQRFDLHQVLDETVELLKNRDEENVHIKRAFNGPLHIKADPLQLKQVFFNLGLNALDAMPEGGELLISTHERDGLVRITFRDTGTGVSAVNLEKVFYPFFTTKEKGTGLGLSIAYRIVEEHDGLITLKSGPDEGAEFDILIPSEYKN
jgi:two-component system sensor histidine kinase PilS (NtrC family)